MELLLSLLTFSMNLPSLNLVCGLLKWFLTLNVSKCY